MVTSSQNIRQASSDAEHDRTDLRGVMDPAIAYTQFAGHSDENRSRSFQTPLVGFGEHSVVGGETNEPPCNLTPPLDNTKVHLPYARDFTGERHQTPEHFSSPYLINHNLEAEFHTLSPAMQQYVMALERHADLTSSITSSSHTGFHFSHHGETEPSKVDSTSNETRFHLQNGLCCVHHGGEDPPHGTFPDAVH